MIICLYYSIKYWFRWYYIGEDWGYIIPLTGYFGDIDNPQYYITLSVLFY